MITSNKRIIVEGDVTTLVHEYALMRKRSRTGRDGKNIMCPHCQSVHKVYHLSWSALTCSKCGVSTDKYDWLIQTEGV